MPIYEPLISLDDRMTFGTRFRICRKTSGLTQNKAADLFGVTRLTIVRWEKNVFKPNYVMIVKIKKEFGAIGF